MVDEDTAASIETDGGDDSLMTTGTAATPALAAGALGTEDPSWKHPHAFHMNLPPHHLDDDGIPLITKYAYKKSRHILALVHSLHLTEAMFDNQDDTDVANEANLGGEEEDFFDEEEDDEELGSQTGDAAQDQDSLGAFVRKCVRLQSQLSSLESLKHSGLTRLELCEMVLHLLKLLTATVTFEYIPDIAKEENGKASSAESNSTSERKRVTLHYENVGYIYTSHDEVYESTQDPSILEQDLQQRFALPSPAREVLLSLAINILSNKGPLRSVSNAAIFPEQDPSSSQAQERFLLLLHWKSLLRTLLRTAPYLDEHKVGTPPMASNSRQNTILKRTVQMIRDARHFFDQGIRPPASSASITSATISSPPIKDFTARQIWEMVKTDVMYHSHTHASYRSLVILYLFQPSRCTAQYYLEVLPLWFDSWTNIDRCPEIDFLWLALFCRARKHLPGDYDWGPIRRRLLTHSQYWLQLPIGGGTMDKSFPRASTPRSRSCPSRLKVFAGASSSYEEGIDFVAKVAKLLVIGLGTSPARDNDADGSSGASENISEGTRDVLRFLSFVTPYFNPSNLGSWTFTLGAFLHYFCYEVCCRVGTAGSMETLKATRPTLVDALCDVEPYLKVASIPAHEIVALMDALLPLCQQALYSKNGHVGRAGEAAMLYLSQIDPARATPAFIDFATRALDITAVNLAHQAPAALSALTRLLQPALRSNPNILLARLPDILRLTLAGIDSNDQNKTIRTLILYRSLTSWIPVGGSPSEWKHLNNTTDGKFRPGVDSKSDGTMQIGNDLIDFLYKPTQSAEYLKALEKLPENSLLKQGTDVEGIDMQLLLEEASSAMSDWVLEFLERVYALLRATGEREKAGKTSSGVASRHSSADVQQARNFSRVLKECLMQTFASMDDEIHRSAVSSVARFLSEETLPSAAKDASFLCQAVAAARVQSGEVTSPGLTALLPVIMDDLDHHSNKTVVYRLRCLSGAVRSCSRAILKHKEEISHAFNFALGSKDKHVYKTGCKLLRHTLAALCESYPLSSDTTPRSVVRKLADSSSVTILGMSSQLHGDPVQWHVPDGPSIQFAWELLQQHVMQRIKDLAPTIDESDAMETDEIDDTAYNLDIPELRRCLRVIRYALRGGAGILLDFDTGADVSDTTAENGSSGIQIADERLDVTLFPYEQAIHKLLKSTSTETYESILQTRGRLCSFIASLTSVIASQTFKVQATGGVADGQSSQSGGGDSGNASDRKYLGLVSSDSKVCKETSDISLLLLTRRGASFRSQEGKTIWKAQKQLATDFALLAQADHMAESLQRSQMYGDSSTVFFKDGEDAGKTLPRRLLVTRVQLFHDSLQRTASFEVPRRLRRLSKVRRAPREILFSTEMNMKGLNSAINEILISTPPLALDGYEGIVDGLFSLCCHSNTQVRASGIGVVDYAITRYGWLVHPRVPRLLAAVNLRDGKMHGKFGVPSCENLVNQVDGQGKRKRLSEAMKGVCSILAMPRAGKQLLGTESTRVEYIKTICGADELVSMMPAEEMQKMVHYLHSIFSPFRLKFYSLPRSSKREHKLHKESLEFLLDILSTEKQKMDSNETADSKAADAKAAHWRRLLLACWFLTALVDEDDLRGTDNELPARLWKTCFQILENDYGQPLQRVALGLFGRLVMMMKSDADSALLREQMLTESFCRVFGHALVYDHKEDSSVGGGHDAQWSAGVADMIRDSARNIAPRSLFPFQRTNQSSGTFKISHAQLVEQILLGLGKTDALVAARHLLSFSKDMAASPPSEDQRNQQCTSAEILAGVFRGLLQILNDDDLSDLWKSDLIPFLDDVIPKIPISLSGAYFDSVRYGIQFSPPNKFYPMTSWLFGKIEGSLWQPQSGMETQESMAETSEGAAKNGSTQGTDGFTAQSKWLYLCCALLVELDETEVDGMMSRTPWYSKYLTDGSGDIDMQQTEEHLKKSWMLVNEKLLPRLVEALGHPYESCRDHIAGCLFRICYCHRKMSRESVPRVSGADAPEDPGAFVVRKLSALKGSNDLSFRNRFNSLITARRFFSYCVHFGEAKYEYSEYIIPLLPLAFEAMKSTIEEGNDDAEADTVARRTLEAEVVKGYRYTIAEVSISSVMSYGRNEDITRVLDVVQEMSKHTFWHVRHACAHFLRGFQGSHKFLFTASHEEKITSIVTELLADERREVSSAAMAAVTGIIAALPDGTVARLVTKYISQANRSTMKKRKKSKGATPDKTAAAPETEDEAMVLKEQKRAKAQQSSVFFLCAAVLAQPYDTPPYVPKALAAISKHSFERNAPLGVRDTVKKCCAEYKRTHMSDNWEVHRKVFTQEELEALEDVVSSPHYYA